MYHLFTFDGFAIEQDGRLLDKPVVHRKALYILVAIAAEGTAGREKLMTLFWPDSDAERARGSLNQALHLLRHRFLAPDLVIGGTELRLNPERITSDVARFELALTKKDFSTAVQLYSGPFLNGVQLQDSPDFEQWAENYRLDLEKRYMEALERLARDAEANDDFVLAAEWWQKLQNTDPYNSRVAMQLMLALGYSGDRAAALQHARRHQELLKNELDMKPDPAISELEEQLRIFGSLPQQHFNPSSKVIPESSKPAYTENFQGQETMPGNSEKASSNGWKPSVMRLRRPIVNTLVLGFLVILTAIVIWIGTPDKGSPENIEFQRGFTNTPEKGSIAVLPFINLSAEPDQEYFSDGITDEIISSLSRVRGLKISGRTSSFQFKGKNPDIHEVRNRLAVDNVLEGSIRKSGDRLRINVQLISTESGFQLWSEIYERSTGDIFDIQEEISRAIILAIQGKISDDVHYSNSNMASQNLEVYELYLKGLYFLNRIQIPLAIRYFEEAVLGDAQFARAYASLAVAYTVPAAYSELSPLELRKKGVEAAQTALRLDPDLADARSALGWLEMIGLEWQAAEKSLKHGVEIDPYAPRGRLYYALYLHRKGRIEQSLQELNIARSLDPLSPLINSIYGLLLGELGHIDEAVHHLEETLELASHPVANAALGHIYLGQGRMNQAIHQYETVYKMVPTSFYAGYLGHAYARAGRIDDARELLSGLIARSDQGEYISPGAIGWIHLGLGEPDEGYLWLEEAVSQRDVFLSIYGMLSISFLTTPYVEDDRFMEIRSGAGLMQMHADM
jgi:TolB-like protein/DNA-binding SARP family transcriptional activator